MPSSFIVLTGPDSGNLLRIHRTVRNLTQVHLARASGVSQSRISRLEAGLVDPTETEVQALADTLGTEPGGIFPSRTVAP